jgi:anti-sigma factor RsiW
MGMDVSCRDRERIFEDGSAEEWLALEAHARICSECAEEVRAWRAISAAASELRADSQKAERESAALWTRISGALAERAAETAASKRRWNWLKVWSGVTVGWQAALAGACVLMLTVAAGWYYVAQHSNSTPNTAIERPDKVQGAGPLLKNSALAEVERTQNAYEQAIEKLAAEAKPQLDNPATPLLASYREKLQVLDSAIDDLRMQAGMNPSNAHLRHELLAMYQEKQETLEEVLEGKQK